MESIEALDEAFSKVKMKNLVTFLHDDRPGKPLWPVTTEQFIKFVSYYLAHKDDPKRPETSYLPGQAPWDLLSGIGPPASYRPELVKQKIHQNFDDNLFSVLASEIVLILEGKGVELRNISSYKIEFPYANRYVSIGYMKKFARILKKMFRGTKFDKDYLVLFDHCITIDHMKGGLMIPDRRSCDHLLLQNKTYGIKIQIPYEDESSVEVILLTYMSEWSKTCVRHRSDCGVKQVVDPIGNPYTCRAVLEKTAPLFNVDAMAYICRVIFARYEKPDKLEKNDIIGQSNINTNSSSSLFNPISGYPLEVPECN